MDEAKHPGGRPPWIPTKKILEEVESYAALGLTKEQIANCLGISYQTLNEKSKEYSEFAEAIKRGLDKGIARMANLLIKHAEAGSVPSVIFFLKARAKWSDQNKDEDNDGTKDLMSKLIDKLK